MYTALKYHKTSPPGVVALANEFNAKFPLLDSAKPEERAKLEAQLEEILRRYNNLGGLAACLPLPEAD
jgi:hypothetical protein